MSVELAVCFDLDGTLVDLPVDIEPARAEIAARFAAHGVVREFRPILAAIDQASAGLADRALGAELRRAARAAIDRAELAAAAAARARPGASALLALLAAHAVPCAIVTDNGRACVAPALAAAGLVAPGVTIVSRDEVARSKPDPEGLVRAARALPGGRTLWWVGDSERDVAAGLAARAGGLVLRIVRVGPAAATDPAPDHAIVGLDQLGPLLGLG